MQVFSIEWTHLDNKESNKYVVQIYGAKEDGTSVCINVHGFKPFFYIHIPGLVDKNVLNIIEQYSKVVYFGKEKNINFSCKKVKSKTILYWQPEELFFFKLSFDSFNDMKAVLHNMQDKIQTFEGNILPYMKLMHIKKLKSCGWLNIQKYLQIPADVTTTTCSVEINCDYLDIESINDKFNTPQFVICAFDIETNSSHGEFPVAKKDYSKAAKEIVIQSQLRGSSRSFVYDFMYQMFYDNTSSFFVYSKENIRPSKKHIENGVPLVQYYLQTEDIKQNELIKKIAELFNKVYPELEGDNIIQIGCIFYKIGNKHPYNKTIITYGTCTEITNEEVILSEMESYKDKKLSDDENEKVKQKLINIQKIEDTSEVTVIACKTETDLLKSFAKVIAQHDPRMMIGYNTTGFDYKYIWDRSCELHIETDIGKIGSIKSKTEKFKHEEKFGGKVVYDYIPTIGRVILDLYKYVQKEKQLDSYKLDYVASCFLNQFKVDVHPQELFKLQRGNADDRKIIARYCMVDCILCIRLIIAFQTIRTAFEMANVCFVPYSFIFLRGQGIKTLSLVSYHADNKFLIPDRKGKETDESYEGAIVLPPIKDIYLDDTIVVGDFNSLYPSIIIHQNISLDKFLGFIKIFPDGTISGNLWERMFSLGYKIICDSIPRVEGVEGKVGWMYNSIQNKYVQFNDIYYDEIVDKKKTGAQYLCRLVLDNQGVIPKIVKSLLDERKKVRNEMKSLEKSDFKYDVLNGKQLALKIVANSVYGQLGASAGPIYCQQLAACITSTGRSLILYSKKYVLEHTPKSKVVYGDTDSIFCVFKIDDAITDEFERIHKAMEFGDQNFVNISESLRTPKMNEEILRKFDHVKFTKFHEKTPDDLRIIIPFEIDMKNITCFLIPILKIDLEKGMVSTIMINKKKYQYFKNEKDEETGAFNNKLKEIYMGNILKRRDNCKLAKIIYAQCTKIIMKDKNIEKAFKYCIDECVKVIEGKYDIDNFVITKSWNGGRYVNPDGIGHHVLAMRIAFRTPGNAPKPGDRIPYVFVTCSNSKAKQGERIESLDFVKENKLHIDYMYYIEHQLIIPLTELFVLVLKKLKTTATYREYVEDIDIQDNLEDETDNIIETVNNNGYIEEDEDFIAEEEEEKEVKEVKENMKYLSQLLFKHVYDRWGTIMSERMYYTHGMHL